jgi:tetratricopeptide (TPR) repeat protein
MPMTFPRGFKTVTILLMLLIFGCTNSRLKEARNAFLENGDPETAVEILEKEGDGAGLSKLLFHMEKGLLLHQAGRFDESITELRNASALMQVQDYLSISQQTASIVINDWMTEYKGEYCERLWVHTYLMINYLLVHHYEDALVEAKQALSVFNAYPEALTQAYFSMALIGFCHEVMNEFNDAYIIYRRLAEMLPDSSPICRLQQKMGSLSGIDDLPDCDVLKGKKDNSFDRWEKGELILFVGLGFAPVKVPGNIILPPGIRFSFPRYERRSSAGWEITIDRGRHSIPAIAVSTNVQQVAESSLADRAKRIYIKEAARVAAKEVIIREVRKEDEVAGWMTRMAMMAVEEPDTRSWHTLPAINSFLRIPLAPDTYHLTVNIEGRDRRSDDIVLPVFTVKKGERRFFAIRASGTYVSVQGQQEMRRTTE